MLATQSLIDSLAERIEWAYRLRRPGWRGQATTPRLWSVAAANLYEAHEADRSLPLDPELYVASQADPAGPGDPWRELTGAEASARYAARVRAIVRSLRRELRDEIGRAEGALRRGATPDAVLAAATRHLSPLARYIVARRAGLPALARRLHDDAAAQHAACPLYREACRRLIDPADYPTEAAATAADPDGPLLSRRVRPQQAHLN